jgi:shikimate kinase
MLPKNPIDLMVLMISLLIKRKINIFFNNYFRYLRKDRPPCVPTFIFLLDVSLAAAAPRVGFNRDRPLLLGNPRAQWQALSDNRRPIYEKLADDAIKVDDMNVGQIVDEIKKNLP